MRAAVGEALELRLRVAIAPDTAERLAVPERNIPGERWRHGARTQIAPCALGLLEAPETVQGETEAVSRPAIERRGNGATREAHEDVARTGRITHPQRGPSAARERPDRERLARLLRDLPEEAVRLIGTSDDVE